ncbi:DUF4430 domain-containing protein, partial [Clostridium lundense]|uniref:DUF4430 domain-containing protein n=1 Tax=Clostridium lundense TaxID=319475 RepID=UPI000556D50B
MSKKRQFKSILCMLMTFVMVFTSVDSGIVGMKTVFAEATKEDSPVVKNGNKATEGSKKDDKALKVKNKATEEKKEVIKEDKKENSSKNVKKDIEKPSVNEEKKDVTNEKLDIHDIVNKIQSDSIGTISIKIVNDFTKVKVGDKIELQVQDENNQALPVENLIFTINDEKLGKMNNYKPNKFMAIGAGSVVIKAALKDKPNISDEVHFKIEENIKDVYIRVEGYDHTIIPRTKVSIPLVDLPKLGTVDKYSNPTHAHAILKVLLDRGFKVGNGEKGTIRYNVPFYLSKLDGDGEFDQGRFSGWMYRVNGELPPVGAEGNYLEDGDEIIWFYGAFGFLNAFTEISVDKTEISENESVVLTAKGEETDINTYEKRLVSMKDTIVVITKIVNGKEENYNGLGEIKTDKDGKATLNFKENGEYKLSLIRYGSDETTKGEKKINIVRPVPITIKVRKNNDKGSEKPVIKLEGIKDGQEVNEENLSFKVTATDNKNKNIKPIVKLNEEVVTGTNGEYKVTLKDGENTITIEATDIAGNRAYEGYKITYKQKTEGKVHLRVELEDETDFSDEIKIPRAEISLKDLLEIPVDDIFEEQKYAPKFNEEGKLISLDEDTCYYSVIINGKVVENPKTVIIKTGDSVICSYNGATKQFKLETPKEAMVNEGFKVIVKDEQDKAIEDAKVFAQYFKYWNGYWDKPIEANTDANGIASFKLETKGDYRIFAEKDGYIRAAAQPIQVILPKIEGDFPKKVNNNEEFNIILTANGKTEPDVKIYWESYYEDKVAYLDNSKLIGKTDANGKATGKIKAPKGEYTLIANFHNNSVNLGQIIVLENDTEKPQIIVNGIKDNTVVSTKEIAFTVQVTDNQDENIIPEVKCNDKVITEKDGKYSVVLNEGNNTIEITAKDKAGNTENKKYTLVYKSNVIVNKVIIEGSKEKLHPKDKSTLKAKAVDEQNNVIPGKEFVFSSSDEKVAIVDAKTGEVTAIGNGTVILTAALKDDAKVKESVKVTVTDKYEVYMRIEGYNHTILPRTKLEVGLFDLSEHLGKASGGSAGESNGWDVSKFEKPTNAHAIVKALVDAGFRQKKAGDTDESKLFDFQDYGWSLYIAMIAGDREHDHAGMSGWLYRVNDDLPPVGCNGTSLNDGDEIVWMYSPYGFDNIYTKVFADETNISVNNDVQIKLIGYTGGYEKIEEKVDGATILVNGKPYIKDGKEVVTDSKGNTVLTFDKPGDYTISATRLDSKGLIDIVRPDPIVIHVRDKKDEQKPEISVKGIMNGETVNKSEITFTVTAKDPQDGKLTPIVKCNDEVLKGKDDNYKAVLKEGKNTITVKAEDKDKNVVEKTFEIICDTKDKTLPQIKVQGIESGITSTQQAEFTVEANDKNDGKITPLVKFNDKEILPLEGKYKALLQEGLNTITIEAVNKLGNKAIEVFKITYKKDTEVSKNKEELRKKILEILPGTVDYSTKESFSNDWVTAGLGRLKDYKNKISP